MTAFILLFWKRE